MAEKSKKPVRKQTQKDEALFISPNEGQKHTHRDLKGLFLPGVPNGGSIKRFKTPEELALKIEEYFNECKEEKKPFTVAGLAFHLGFSSRQSIWNYEKESGYEAFHEILERAKLVIQMQMEEHLMTKQNVAGIIFLAKNYSYTDVQTVDLTSKNAFLTQLVPVEPQTIKLDENH